MSIYTDSFEACVMLDKTTVPDGYGGFRYAWVEGAAFEAMIGFDGSKETKIAAAQFEVSRYRVLTPKAVNLQYHDVFRRLSDSKVFRVTTDGDDFKTPRSAGLQLRAVDAEEWEIPTDE